MGGTNEYPPQQPPVIMVPGVIQTVSPVTVGPKPSTMTCPSCGERIVTKVVHKPTTKTHLITLGLCCCLCWCCLCLPYCMDSCQNADHYCPNCDSFVGVYYH